jgi:hypothetical protein
LETRHSSDCAHSPEFVDLLAVFKSPEDFLVTGEKLDGRNGKFGDSVHLMGDKRLPSKICVLLDESARGHLPIDALWPAIRVSEERLLQVREAN